MTGRLDTASPPTRARLTGVVYLLFFATAVLGSVVAPGIIGALIALAGLGWLTFLSPPVANQLLTPLEVLGFVAEASLMLWLLVIGVNSQRWAEQAA
jgi:hypothetical protein